MSARDDLQRTLADIAARDGGLKSFVAVHDTAGAQRELDRALAHRGALQGLAVGVKDIFDTAALPSQYGSALFAGHQPRLDAAIVQAVRRAGGVVVGKTATTEFAFLNPAPTLNPNAAGRTPGGSSAGSAASVAAGLVPLGIGTQTGGSVIRPASYCGVVGFKPTFGALPTPGLKPFSWSLDTVGLFTQRVTDMARWASALSGRTWTSQGAKPVVGIAWSYPFGELTPSARLALETARDKLRAAGVTVKDVDLPAWVADVHKAHDAVQGWEAVRALRDEFEFHADQLSAVLRDYLRDAQEVDDRAYEQGQATAAAGRGKLQQLFDGIDVLLAPSAPDEPPAGYGSTGASTFNRAWTLLHVPCVSVPGAKGVNGFPMGVQVVAPVGEDALCLRAAALLQASFGH
ncbi:amidase [Ramlibacter algicola]|uniref:Amidase n=1 Tax=Ramlibacter algicola TaxID=2795217 RepID=A0A934Q1D9_9BURK|nr:amidase [Ramlibacter algicola]MBK0392837.1 amidase [Ramlibacter algicola]